MTINELDDIYPSGSTEEIQFLQNILLALLDYANFSNTWIGRDHPKHWTLGPLEFNPVDYHICDHLKFKKTL